MRRSALRFVENSSCELAWVVDLWSHGVLYWLLLFLPCLALPLPCLCLALPCLALPCLCPAQRCGKRYWTEAPNAKHGQGQHNSAHIVPRSQPSDLLNLQSPHDVLSSLAKSQPDLLGKKLGQRLQAKLERILESKGGCFKPEEEFFKEYIEDYVVDYAGEAYLDFPHLPDYFGT